MADPLQAVKKDPWPDRCPATSPGGVTKDGTLPRKGTRCGNYKGHDGNHTILIPTSAPWFPNASRERRGDR